MGNTYQDIFQESNIEFVPYKSDVEAKGISEAAKVIKCMKKGIKYKELIEIMLLHYKNT